MKILFLHGWNSVPGGVKPTYLKDHGHEVINPALPHEGFGEAVRIAQAEFDKHQPQVVVGSSRGGAAAMNINSGNARLVLLCPAWKKYRTARTVKPSTVTRLSPSGGSSFTAASATWVTPFAKTKQEPPFSASRTHQESHDDWLRQVRPPAIAYGSGCQQANPLACSVFAHRAG